MVGCGSARWGLALYSCFYSKFSLEEKIQNLIQSEIPMTNDPSANKPARPSERFHWSVSSSSSGTDSDHKLRNGSPTPFNWSLMREFVRGLSLPGSLEDSITPSVQSHSYSGCKDRPIYELRASYGFAYSMVIICHWCLTQFIPLQRCGISPPFVVVEAYICYLECDGGINVSAIAMVHTLSWVNLNGRLCTKSLGLLV
jgi:hypothetical protein